MANCLYESALQKIEKDCHCVPATFAKFLNTSLEGCFGPKKRCMSAVMSQIGSDRFIEDSGETKECLVACEDQDNQFLVTSSSYPNKRSFHESRDYCAVLAKLRISCFDEKRVTLDLEYPLLCPLVEEVDSTLSCDDVSHNSSMGDLHRQVQACTIIFCDTYRTITLVIEDCRVRQ